MLRANRAAGLDVEAIEDGRFFIPQHSVAAFADALARTAGGAAFGLSLVHHMDVSTYGTFGRYIFDADTLHGAIRLLASWAAMAGDLGTARAAATKLLAVNPEFTVRRYLAIPAFQDMPDYRDRLAQGLRDAGLPES